MNAARVLKFMKVNVTEKSKNPKFSRGDVVRIGHISCADHNRKSVGIVISVVGLTTDADSVFLSELPIVVRTNLGLILRFDEEGYYVANHGQRDTTYKIESYMVTLLY